jgi:hypothetical protein
VLDPLYRWERRIAALPMPSPLVWSVLVVACLGFGVLMGRATGPNSPTALASQRAPLKLVVAQTSSPEATPPPLPSSEATPEPSGSEASGSEATGEEASSEPLEAGDGGEQESSLSAPAEASKRPPKGKAAPKKPKIKHVFVVMLSDEPYATAFGPASPAHYLTGTLEKEGRLLVRYYAVAHEGLANGIALLSGQGPTEATAANCPAYSDVAPGTVEPGGQVLGQGCAYPASTQTLLGQLTAKHLTWKAYVGGIAEAGSSAKACTPPVTGSSGSDPGGLYLASRNPIVYFHSLLGSSRCASDDVGIGSLEQDLRSRSATANFSYISPGPCDDGDPTPCAAGKPAGMTAADGFLKRVVPEILDSKAYKHGGLLAITVDNAPSTGEFADSSSCCGQPRLPNLPAPSGAAALSPPGGGQVGLLLMAPFITKGSLVQDIYSHFSLLASIERIFGLSRLGYAGLSEEKPFSESLLSSG